MRKILALYGTAMFVVLGNVPAFAQSAPGQTVNVTPNQQTTEASAVSSPSGQNISQQNNFYDPGNNSFGPGIQCSGPYLASSLYHDNSSNPGSVGVGGFSDVGGTVGIVVPLNGSNKKCQEFVNEIVFQRQIDTCLSMLKQGFTFDPNGQYASLAKRCAGIRYTGQPIGTANPVSPAPPPTVITVPANPQSNAAPLLGVPGGHGLTGNVAPAASVQTVAVAAAPASASAIPAAAPRVPSASSVVHQGSYCQKIDEARKKRLIEKFKAGIARHDALDALHAACVPDSEIMAAL